MYAIYLKNDRDGRTVLLTDGCFTAEGNCYMREYGYVWHKPELFHTKGGAKNFAAKEGLAGRVQIAKYTGPTEPWDRENGNAA